MGRRETVEAPIETTPMTPLTAAELDDERPSRSKLQVKGKLDQALRKRTEPLGPEEPSAKRRAADEERRRELGAEDASARRRDAQEESSRRKNPELGDDSGRRRNPEPHRRSEPRALEPVTSASQPSIDTVPEGNPKQPAVTERYTPEPINPIIRIGVVAVVAFSLLLAIAWRLGWF